MKLEEYNIIGNKDNYCPICLNDKKITLVQTSNINFHCSECKLKFKFDFDFPNKGYKLLYVTIKYNDINFTFDKLDTTEIDYNKHQSNLIEEIYLNYSYLKAFLRHRDNGTINKFIQMITLLTD